MPLDPRSLRPAELLRLLNSTPLGQVLTERRLRDHRAAAGYRIGDGQHLDLFRYTAWLASERHRPAGETAEAGEASYERVKEKARARNAALSRSGRDIAPLPVVVDLDRRAKGLASLEAFLLSYFPETFTLPFGDDHRLVIEALEMAVLDGGLFAYAMPRGSGKTSICERAAIWAALTGRHEFIALIGAEATAAEEMLEAIKTELETNELLAEDFPEVCYPIRRLEGITNRARGQLFEGERTRISWTKKAIVLPTIPGSSASGVILKCAGFTARIRGMKHARADGHQVRPSLAILDDPQTDRTVRTDQAVERLESTLAGAVLNLAGPGKKIAAVCPCTVIRPGDLADRLLDPKKHPEWQGCRCPMVYSFPRAEVLWDQYASILRECWRDREPIARATDFYAEHREAMDDGAQVAWAFRYNPDEISALQHAMNLRIRDEAAFFAECQNAPISEDEGAEEQLRADEVLAKLNGYKRREVPLGLANLVGFIDVHDRLLYYGVGAWAQGFRGSVIDYGTWPEQRRRYFRMREASPTLLDKMKGEAKEAAILAGLEELIEKMMATEWRREDGQLLRIGLLLIDAGYVPEVIYKAIRRSRFAALVMPSTGLPLKAANKPFAEYSRQPGDVVGNHWRVPSVRGKRMLPSVQIDVNYWKARLRDGWRVPAGDKKNASIELFGKSKAEHQLFADHQAAESFVRTAARGRVVDEFELRAGKPDNHWFDVSVGLMVAASIRGIQFSVLAKAKEKKKPRRPPPTYL